MEEIEGRPREKRKSRKTLNSAVNRAVASILVTLGCELSTAELLLARALMEAGVMTAISESVGETICNCLGENEGCKNA